MVPRGVELRGEYVAAAPTTDQDLPSAVARALQEENRARAGGGEARGDQPGGARADDHDGERVFSFQVSVSATSVECRANPPFRRSANATP